MNQIDRYLIGETARPFAAFAAVLTIAVWLTQSLQMLDLVINRGQSALTFALLTLYVLPSLLVYIVPVALFAAALYALYRLSGDSELIVLWASGLSRWALVRPMLIVGVAVTLLVYLLHLWLMPLGMRTLKDQVFDIRADVAAMLVREGVFLTPAEGLTVFIRETGGDGEIRGLFVHDNRDPDNAVSYFAERSALVRTARGTQLIMENGRIQSRAGERGTLTNVEFVRHSLDLSVFMRERQDGRREASERWLSELLSPDFVNDQQRARLEGPFLAEAHNRLSAPLYCIAFVLIAAAALTAGRFARRGLGLRIAIAVAAALGVRLLGLGVQAAAGTVTALIPLLYALPVLASVAAAAYVAGLLPRESAPEAGPGAEPEAAAGVSR